MPVLRIHNWEKWQSYRSDRSAPKWIKLHRRLMTCSRWGELSDAEKGQLVSIWIVASDRDGFIPSDPKTLRKICLLDSEPSIPRFVSLGFIDTCEGDAVLTSKSCQNDVTVTPESCHRDAPEEKRREEKREEENSPPPPSSEEGGVCATATTEEQQPAKKAKKAKPKKPKPDPADPLFAEFWAAYPRKDAKQDAFKAWGQVGPVDRAMLDTLLAAIDRQGHSRQWKEGYIPLPATWLRGRRWEDGGIQTPPNGRSSPLRAPSAVELAFEEARREQERLDAENRARYERETAEFEARRMANGLTVEEQVQRDMEEDWAKRRGCVSV